jgi:hypothetical protein
MEAATPLRQAQVRTAGDRLVVDALVVEDECAVRLVREREQAGEDPARTVTDAIEIGARVLDRQHAAANTEFVKTEFEKASRQLEAEFTDKARTVAEHFGSKVDEVFGPDGRQAKELEKLFSDGSSASVQNRVRELLGEMLSKSREDLVRAFTSGDASNPLAEFKNATTRTIERAEQRQHATQQALLGQMTELEKQLQALRDEQDKREAVEAERERGTAKGRSFEHQVAEAVDALATAQGDDAEAVGDLKDATGKVGDVVVSIDACNGPARGRIVFEAKDRRLSKPRAIQELDKARDQRSADFAVLVVPTEEEVPAKLQTLREYNGDKLIVALEPEGDPDLALELAYRLARARVLMKRGDVEGIDATAVRDSVDRALQAMADVRRVKQNLTGAKTTIDKAAEILEAMVDRVRAHLDEIDGLAQAGDSTTDADGPPDGDDDQLPLR